MNYDIKQFEETFNLWNKRIAEYKLPQWDHLPLIELYMDQVTTLINDYLKIYSDAFGDQKGITQSMINNYVKLKIIPAPVKKKYSRTHLAYLIIVCILKQTLNISTIQSIIPMDLSENEVKEIYNSFVKNQHKSYSYVSEHVNAIASYIFENEGENPERLNDLIMQVASSANIFKMLSEIIVNSSNTEEEPTE